MEAGADIEGQATTGLTPLSFATLNGAEDIACYLLENGADINRGTIGGDTPLLVAARRGNLQVGIDWLVFKICNLFRLGSGGNHLEFGSMQSGSPKKFRGVVFESIILL